MGNLFSKDDDHKAKKKAKSAPPAAATTSSSPNTNAANGSPAPAASKINSYDRCMLQLKLQRDKLNAASRLYDQRADVEKNLAKQFLAEGKREKALYCLKRKKAQEVHLDRVQKYLDNIMTMMQNVEAKQFDNEVANALKQGADELKALNEHLSLDDIEKIMENASEQISITNEASALLAQNLVSLDEDDEDILNELDELCAADNKPVATKSSTTTTEADKKAALAKAEADAEAAAKAKAQLENVSVPTGAVEGGHVSVDAEADEVAEEQQEEEESSGRVALSA